MYLLVLALHVLASVSGPFRKAIKVNEIFLQFQVGFALKQTAEIFFSVFFFPHILSFYKIKYLLPKKKMFQCLRKASS